ncbi:hypothetical protein KIL84_005064 [Mauremys mutica]|uniref:Uncharacterized protein n=1 Tax=Mauremys mutica TaxID=74926 RepID=A0A9D3XK17_9SAUR|nr:hypothetical protein KIL84_005064 [Mauremys mutica]
MSGNDSQPCAAQIFGRKTGRKDCPNVYQRLLIGSGFITMYNLCFPPPPTTSLAGASSLNVTHAGGVCGGNGGERRKGYYAILGILMRCSPELVPTEVIGQSPVHSNSYWMRAKVNFNESRSLFIIKTITGIF